MAPPAFNFTVAPALSAFNVPMKQYLTTHDQHETALASGAMIFNSQNRLLLVQRAAHDSMPNLWEIPGGAVDNEDSTILHGVVREVFEESGLLVKDVKQQVGEGHVFFSRRGWRIVKFSFVVEVEGTDVKLDPNEHQRFVWASEEECQNGKVLGEGTDEGMEISITTAAQKRTVLEGFRLRREERDGV